MTALAILGGLGLLFGALLGIASIADVYKRQVDGFRKMGLSCFEPLGAFYVFPCIKSTGYGSNEFCERLLEEEKVAVVPGNAFGESGEGFIRCSYAYSVEQITEALARIERFVKRHKKNSL